MINIIDAYESDAKASDKADEEDHEQRDITDPRPSSEGSAGRRVAAADRSAASSALGQDRQADVPPRLHLRDRRRPRPGLRETFVVVASKQELDLSDLGRRDDDPKFYQQQQPHRARPYNPEDVRRPSTTVARNHPHRRLRPGRKPPGPSRRDPGR